MEKTTIQIEIPVEIVMLCDIFDIKPEELLSAYMEDLCSMKSNQGSDERRMAKEYFLRGGIAMPGWLDNDNVDVGISVYEIQSDLIEQFADMYTENYPAIANTEYDEKRKKQLEDWYSKAKKIKNLKAIASSRTDQ